MAVDPARAKSLFLAASDLADPAELAAYLDRECGGDAELRARVGALLRANDAAPLPVAPEADLFTFRAPCPVGDRETPTGPYHLLCVSKRVESQRRLSRIGASSPR